MRWLTYLWLVIAVSTAAASAEASAATSATSRGIELARVVIRLNDGQQWGVMGRPGFVRCFERGGELYWKSGQIEANTPRLKGVFDTEVRAANLAIADDNLFDEGPKDALQLGALITAIDSRLCELNDAKSVLPTAENPYPRQPTPVWIYKGSMALTVEWQIFDPSRRAVIAKITTKEVGQLSEWEKDGVAVAFVEAMRVNMRALINSAEYRRAADAEVGSAQSVTPGAPLTFAPGSTPTRTMAEAAKSVASIFAGNSMGSGVLISSDGYVLTNHHVVGQLTRVRVQWADGTSTDGEVLRSDAKRDVALIKAIGSIPPLTIRTSPVKLGDTVYAIGTPLDRSLAGTLTRGVVSGFRVQDGLPILQSDVAVTHGNSGGPLLDENGQVVALTVAGRVENGAPVSINFFIPIEDALRALAMQPQVAQ